MPRLLSGRYLFGRIPLTHVVALTSQLLGILYVASDFNTNFTMRPVLTTMVLNSLLNGLADTVAQSVTAVRQSGTKRRRAAATKRGPSIDLHEFGEKATLGATRGELFATSVFDYDRMVRFLGWGFIMAPVQLEWFAYLGQVFPITENNQTAMSICRMLCDQILWSPISLALFFIFLTVAEGGGKRAISRKFGVAFIPSLKANFVVWPLVQIINFRWIPLQAQLPFASTVGVFWTTYLSLKNDAADAALLAAASV